MNHKKITESILAKFFEKALNKRTHFKEFPKFKLIYKEVSCQQGIADFIATTGPLPSLRLVNKSSKRPYSTESSAKILSLLRFLSPRTKTHILKKSGFTSKTISRVLNLLLEKGYIYRKKKDSYFLAPALRKKPSEFWAFELKLNNWKRALFQASQYKAFANRVMLVFPPEREKILKRNLSKFKKLKIGIMTFDVKTQKYTLLSWPTKNKPTSRAHNFFLFSKVISLNGKLNTK